jgi:hypothetical protein
MMALGDTAGAQLVADKLLEFVVEHDIQLFRPAAYLLDAQVCLRQERFTDLPARLLRACRDAEKLEVSGTLYLSLIALSDWEMNTNNSDGDLARAAHYRARAAALISRIAGAITNEAMREAFLDRPEIRPVLESA